MDKVKSFFKTPWGSSLLILIFWNLIVRAIAVLGYFILPARFAPLDFIAPIFQSNYIFWSLANFDGEHYLSIARDGYQFRGGFPQYAFFPLFPLLIKLVNYVVGDYYVSGMLISQLSLWVALTYIYKWAKLLRLNDLRLPLLASSGGVFLASIYTEPVFIALAAMTFYFSEKKWWGRAVITTALATATRVNGILLAIYLAIKMIQSQKKIEIALTSFVGAISGLVSYMVFLAYKTGDPLAWYNSQSSWGKADPTSPLTTAISYLKAITTEFTLDLVHLVVIFEVVITVITFALLFKLIKSRLLGLSYIVYLSLNLAMPVMTGSLGSMPRFFLTLFPLLVVIPHLSRRTQKLYYIVMTPITISGIILFTRGYWFG